MRKKIFILKVKNFYKGMKTELNKGNKEKQK